MKNYEPGSISFSWWDRTGDIDDIYLFVTSGLPEVKEDTIEHFVNAVHQACYERKYNRSGEDATDAQLAEFRNDRCVILVDVDVAMSHRIRA